MSFIERLRQQKAAEEARLAAERERGAESHNAFMARMAEQERRQAAGGRALDNSAVPQMASELADLTGGSSNRQDGDPSTLYVFYNDGKQKRFGQTYELSRLITIQGREDGSVQIGPSVLGPQDARNPEKVDRALETAYTSMQQRKVNVTHLRKPPPQDDGSG